MSLESVANRVFAAQVAAATSLRERAVPHDPASATSSLKLKLPNRGGSKRSIDKLVDFIPTEAVAGFLAASGIIATRPPVSVTAEWVVFAVFLILTVLYEAARIARKFEKKYRTWPKLGDIPRAELIVVAGAFVAWSMAIPGSALYGSVGPLVAALAIPIATAIVSGISPWLY